MAAVVSGGAAACRPSISKGTLPPGGKLRWHAASILQAVQSPW